MSVLFLRILNMSISASWLILAVLGLRLVLRKMPKWTRVVLWGIVAARLLFPFSIESAFSLIPSAEPVPLDIGPVQNTPATGTGVDLLQIVAVCANIWLLGVAALLACGAVSCLRLRNKVRTAVHLRENIFQSEYLASPFVMGVLCPKIYLPFKMNGQDPEYVIAHERAHIRRRDHWWKPLGYLLMTVHWYNPLMWVAYELLCRDIELACDETVIRDMDNEDRANYAQILVAYSVDHRTVLACPVAFGEVGVKARVKSIMNYQKPSRWGNALSLVLCAAVAVCFMTNPVNAEEAAVPGSAAQEVHSKDIVIPIQALYEESAGDGTQEKERPSIEEIQKQQEELEEKLAQLLEEVQQLLEEERIP